MLLHLQGQCKHTQTDNINKTRGDSFEASKLIFEAVSALACNFCSAIESTFGIAFQDLIFLADTKITFS